jgi:hypothetical protein
MDDGGEDTWDCEISTLTRRFIENEILSRGGGDMGGE